VRGNVHGDGRRGPALRRAAATVHPRAAAERPPTRRRPPRTTSPHRRSAAEHVERTGGVSIPATLPVRGGAVAPGSAAAAPDRAGTHGRVFQPRCGGGVG